MLSLPTLRRKILRSFSLVVVLYAILGILLVLSVKIASSTTPKLLHVNYDSIAAAHRMSEAWNALQYPSYAVSSSRSREDWIYQFEEALAFESSNLTEPGEKEITNRIRKRWEEVKGRIGRVSDQDSEDMRLDFDQLIAVNEKGMFGLAQQNVRLSERVQLGALIYFFLSLVLCVLFADSLSQRLSSPIKSIAEAIHNRRGFSRRLKLPEPTNLEILILTTELSRLWERLSEAEKINVAEVLQQKQKLEVVLESVEDGLLVLEADRTVSHCNSCLLGLIGLERNEVQGKRWEDLATADENYLRLRSVLRENMSEGQQIDLKWRNGNAQFSARSRRIASAEAGKAGVLYLLHDITEKKQREKFRSEFIDLLSHELKTPLQSLGTASELLVSQKAQFSEDQRLLVDTVAEDVERIRAVANEFVQITQSHAKILKLKMELVAVNQVLPEWLKPFSVIGKDRKIRIEFMQTGGEIIWANLDRVKFPWVVSNIIANAVRFSPEGGAVQVHLASSGGWVSIRITDAGPGIPDDEQNRIFEPFYQSSVPAVSGIRGLFGIGLTIAKEVVEAHDGRIEYARLQPQGSEFTILIPAPAGQYGEDSREKGETKPWTH